MQMWRTENAGVFWLQISYYNIQPHEKREPKKRGGCNARGSAAREDGILPAQHFMPTDRATYHSPVGRSKA